MRHGPPKAGAEYDMSNGDWELIEQSQCRLLPAMHHIWLSLSEEVLWSGRHPHWSGRRSFGVIAGVLCLLALFTSSNKDV